MNPRLAAATQSAATQSMEHTTREIIELVRPLPRTLLLWRPSPDVWSILDNLAHIEEFVPFWIGEIQAMLSTPPQPWGRDQSHPGRLAAVQDTSQRNLDELLAGIDSRVTAACTFLRTLNDSQLDIEAESRNPRWAIKPVSFVVDSLLVKHLSDHRGQIQRNLRQAAEVGLR
jgi:uncharacterized damage-inducible protein DinB